MLNFQGGTNATAQAGGGITSGSSSAVGNTTNGTMTVSGAGSFFNAPGLISVAAGASVGSLTFNNGATSTCNGLTVGTGTGGSQGTLNVLTGSVITSSGSLSIASTPAVAAIGNVTLDGAGSALNITGSALVNIGSSSISEGTLFVEPGGTLTTGTGTISVGATGTLEIIGGTVNSGGHLIVRGVLTRSNGGALNLGPGRALSCLSGGDAFLTGSYTASNSSIFVSSSGSSFTVFSGGANIEQGGTFTVENGGDSTIAQGLNVGLNGTGEVLVTGSGSTLSSPGVCRWGDTAGATLTFSDAAFGSFGSVRIADSIAPGTTATVSLESAAEVRMDDLSIATQGGTATGAVSVSGPGALLEINGAGDAVIGQFGTAGSASLTLSDSGSFQSGTGVLGVLDTGTIAVTDGSACICNGDLFVSGGLITSDTTSTLNLINNADLTMSAGGVIQTGSPFSVSGTGTASLTGTGTLLTTTAGSNAGIAFTGAALDITGGADVVSDAGVLLGSGGSTQVTVDGSGSALSAHPGYISNWTGGSSAPVITFRNNSSGSAGLVNLGSGPGTTLHVQSGADVAFSSLRMAQSAGSVATANVGGPGSTLTVQDSDLIVAGNSNSSATLNITPGGTVTLAPFGATNNLVLNPGGTVNLSGGTLTLSAPTQQNGGLIHFNSGVLNLAEPLPIGPGGMFGSNFTLTPLHELNLPANAATTIAPVSLLTLDGGSLTTGSLAVNGTLDFRSGALNITGPAGLTFGSGFSGNFRLREGASLDLTTTAATTTAAIFTLDGGEFTAATFSNAGTARLDRGYAFTNTFNNNATGRTFIGDLHQAITFNNNTGARLTMEDGVLLGGILNNAGLLAGTGTLAATLSNTGEVRAEPGKTLMLDGPGNSNLARFNLQGGALYFAAQVNNTATAQINGHGVLSVPATPVPTTATPTAGLINSGQMNLSGGDSLIFGTVANNAGGRVIASGGASATFFDVFRHAGTEVKASAGSALVFFGEVRGPGSFTGTGTIYMEGGYSPGASPASVSIAPQTVLTASNVLTMELAGTTPGTQHDKLTFTHAAAPQVTWGGALTVTFLPGYTPAAGHTFDLFDFDAALDTGTFTALNLPALPAGLTWDTTQLYTSGTITVVAEGLTFNAWATASGIPGALPTGDHDSDGFDNATEFALGLFPPQLGTVLPDGGFHTYIEGERLRLLFTRPLDRTGVTLIVQASDDLSTWTDLATSVNSQPFTGPGFVSENRSHPLNEPGEVEVRDILNTATTPRRQMRVRIEIAP